MMLMSVSDGLMMMLMSVSDGLQGGEDKACTEASEAR